MTQENVSSNHFILLPLTQICLWYSAGTADTYDINICICCIIKLGDDPRPDLDRTHYGEKITEYKMSLPLNASVTFVSDVILCQSVGEILKICLRTEGIS